MTLRIGFDLDGVLADMAASVNREARAAFAVAVEEPTAETTPAADETEAPPAEEAGNGEVGPHLTRSQRRQLWKRISQIENFWESLDETEPGIVARLWTLTQERRWEVIFLTKRPSTLGDITQLQSHRWLQRHGFPAPSVFVVQESRGRIAAALNLDVIVDDTPDNCVDVLAESRAKAILIIREQDPRIAPRARRLGVGVVTSVNECLNILADADARGPSRPYFMDRLMHLLGIRRAAPRLPDTQLAEF